MDKGGGTPGLGEQEPVSGTAVETSTPGGGAVACPGLRWGWAALPRGGCGVKAPCAPPPSPG